MGEMVAPTRTKRGRSPSPSSYADTLASPLEVLLKRRRRRAEWRQASGNDGFVLPPPPAPVWRPELSAEAPGLQRSSSHERRPDDMEVLRSSSPHRRSGYSSATDVEEDEPESSTNWMRTGGVERRRARAWERLQAPTHSSSSLSQPLRVSQPELPQHGDHMSSSPAARAYVRARANSQPMPHHHHPQHTPSRHPHVGMSSSPVRHSPPSSTPFRGDEWTAEERIREWGDEYATQNSLLFSLHQARHASSSHHGQSSTNNTPYSSHTMDMSYTPYAAVPTPYRYARDGHGLLETPGLEQSSPYMSSPELVSPFASQSTVTAHSGIAPPLQMDASARANYEHTNRLLAELNVQRMRRYQAPPPSPADLQQQFQLAQAHQHQDHADSAMDES